MPSIRRVARAGLPTYHGDFEMFVYGVADGKDQVALTTGFEPGNPKRDVPVLVRLHSECLTGDVFGSRRCDCDVAAEMLLDLGVNQVAALTNNAAKVEGSRNPGVEVVERLPVQAEPNPVNISYLRTKKKKLGHAPPSSVLPDEDRAEDSAGEAS